MGIRKLLRAFITFALVGLLLNINFQISGSASELEFQDEKSNSWISVSAKTYEGDLNIKWSSELPDVQVQISGPNNLEIDGDSDGDIWEHPESGHSQGEYTFRAVRQLPDKQEGESAVPVFQEYITSLNLGNSESIMPFFLPQSASATAAAAKTYLRYQTFIPDAYLGAPASGCTPGGSEFIFEGNGRSFNPDSSSFKTRFQVTVDWTNNGELTYSRTVKPTKRYLIGPNGQPRIETEETAMATNGNMIFEEKSTSSTLAHFKLDHSVTNPMCNEFFTFPIWYKTDVWIARSGAYTVTNEYRRAPNHELYLKDSDENTWTPLLQAYTYSMECFNKTSLTQLWCSGNFKSNPGAKR